MANEHPYRARKELHCQKRRSYMARRPLSKPICAKEERNGLPSADQGLSTAKPRSSHAVCTLQMHPPTSPCPALSAKIKDKAGCDRCENMNIINSNNDQLNHPPTREVVV